MYPLSSGAVGPMADLGCGRALKVRGIEVPRERCGRGYLLPTGGGDWGEGCGPSHSPLTQKFF